MFELLGFRNSRGPVLQGHGPVSDSLRRLEDTLTALNVPHIYVGRVATNAHGHARGTSDIDVCVRPADLDRLYDGAAANGYEIRQRRWRGLRDLETGVAVDVIQSGAPVGLRPQQRGLVFPDPAEAETHAGIPVPSLTRLIELKLALWRFKDWADVIELIRELHLARELGDRLNPAVRELFEDCYQRRIEEDAYDPQIHDAPAGK